MRPKPADRDGALRPEDGVSLGGRARLRLLSAAPPNPATAEQTRSAPPQKLLALCGSRVALLAVVLLAAGWAISGPLAVSRYAQEDPFRVDYLAYDTGATIIRHGDASRIYDPRLQHDVQESRTGNHGQPFTAYLNPPVVAALFVPLTSLPVREGYVAVVGLLAVVLVAAAALLFRLLDAVPGGARWFTAACVVGSTGSASAIMSGQLTPLLLLIAFGAMLAFRARRVEAAGVVLGVLFVKPHFALAVLVVLLIARQRKAAAYMCATLAAGVLASFAIVGIDGIEGYVSLMRRSYLHPAQLFIDVRTEQNVRGLAASVFGVYGGTWLAATSLAITLGVFGVVAAAIARSPFRGNEHMHYVAALCAVIICSAAPHIQYYDLALLALPASFIVIRASKTAPALRARFYGVLVITVLWVELAGMLTGARISVSVMPILAFTLMLAAWPRFEGWLTQSPAGAGLAQDVPLLARSA